MSIDENVNQEFYDKANIAFRELFDVARNRNELQFALALVPEMRGFQDAGWNTAVAIPHVVNEYMEFLENQKLGRIMNRVALSFYCHIAEASGFYEIPKNMLRIAEGLDHVILPFDDIVQIHKQTGDSIAPNANKIFKNLVGHSQTLGFNTLSEVFRDAFDPDIRNGYAHADYVVWRDGLRLPKRNGGQGKKVSWDEFWLIFERGITFFGILQEVVSDHTKSYDPPKTIKAHLGNSPVIDYTISYDPNSGSFSIKNH